MNGPVETSIVDSNCITASNCIDALNSAGDLNCADALFNTDNAASIIYPLTR